MSCKRSIQSLLHELSGDQKAITLNVINILFGDGVGLGMVACAIYYQGHFRGLARAFASRAFEPGGCLVAGQYRMPDEAQPAALVRLQIARRGGYPWRTGEVDELMRAVGFEHVETTGGKPGPELFLGYRPSPKPFSGFCKGRMPGRGAASALRIETGRCLLRVHDRRPCSRSPRR